MAVKTVFRFLLVSVVFGAMLTSCHKNGYKNNSRATGWDLTGKHDQPSYQTDYDEQETGPGLVFIEGGTFTMGKVADNPMHDWNNTPTQQTVSSFYMDETEVTNRMYLQYLDWLKWTFPPSEGKYSKIYQGALPDTLVWRSPLKNSESLVNNYLRHPAYQNYPVVGVTWIQAVEFSKWRTDRVNEKLLADAGYTEEEARYKNSEGTPFTTESYLFAPEQTYGGSDSLIRGGKNADNLRGVINGDTVHKYVKRKDGVMLPDYRLPTEAEWEYAALGLSSDRTYNNYRGRKKFPWDGSTTTRDNRTKHGDQLANFKQGKGDYSGVAGWSDDGANITSEIKSYPPNDNGLYDMAGNVAEWVADVYRPRVDNEMNDFNYYRGNVYTENALNKDGSVKIIDDGNIQYDTLSNGRIVATGLPGEVAQQDLSEDETYLRTNYDRGDNRDYRDGDKQSSRYYYQDEEPKGDKRMYNSPMNKVISAEDSTGQQTLQRQIDQSNSRTTLIDNKARVYKGGSWKDRAYWLDPAERRYYPQDMATNYIGFRNAMSRVGSESKKGRRARD